MNTINRFRLTCLISAFVLNLTSCNKGNSASDSGNGIVNTDHTLISKFILLDTLKPRPFDTLEIISFNYDALKRVSQRSDIYYNSLGHPDTSSYSNRYWKITSLYYTGEDTLPTRLIVKEEDNIAYIRFSIDTSYRKYDLNARLIKDSSRDYSYISGGINNGTRGASLAEYIYTSQLVYRKQSAVSSPNNFVVDSVVQATSGNNITYQKDPRPVPTNYQYSLWPTCNFIFDGHPNPMCKNGLNMEPLYNSYNTFGIGINFQNQRSNYLSVKKSTPIPSGSNDFYFSYDYKYRADFYPLQVIIISHTAFGTPYGYKGVYLYN